MSASMRCRELEAEATELEESAAFRLLLVENLQERADKLRADVDEMLALARQKREASRA